MKVFRSLRWQIQSWHSILLVLIVGGMLTAFYYYERQVKVQLLDKELWNPVHAILPAFVRSPNQNGPTEAEGRGRDQLGPRRGPPSEVDFDSRDGTRRPPPEWGGGSRDGTRRPPPRHFTDGGDQRRLPPRHREGVTEEEFLQQPREIPAGEFANRRPSPEGGNPELRHSRPIERVESQGYYVLAWDSEKELYRSDNAPVNVPMPSTVRGGRDMENGVRSRWNGENREVIQPTPAGGVLVGISGDRIAEDLSIFRVKLIGLGLVIVFIGFTGGWWIARRAMKPLQAMAQTAVQISEGDLSRRIDLEQVENELGDLGCVLNDSFEKIEASVMQQIRFTGDASHEMRTPLAVILAKTELALMRERSPEKYRETIQVCHDSAEHMQSLIESLLELAKVDSGQFIVEPASGQLSELVEDVVSLLEPLALMRDIDVSVETFPVTVGFDVQRMKQVLINLMSNAIKYNRNGGEVHVSMKNSSDWVEVVVRDTGPGITEEALPHIFDRFYKVDDSRASERGSTGLGLSISKAIVEAHGGEIKVESKVNIGTTFIVRLRKNES